MEYSFFSKEKSKQCKKKVIPWHVQKRYMESLSQLSLNQSYAEAFYKRQINSLKRNNKHLAVALQKSRYLATEKENLLIDNGKILDIINFSRLKLMDMSINMKRATDCLDEALLLLNSAVTDNLAKISPNNPNYRNDFRNKLQELKIDSIKEVHESPSESSDSSYKNTKSYTHHKGKISRVDGCISSPNKKSKLEKKGISKDVPKLSKRSSAASNIVTKDNNVKNSKKLVSAINIKSHRKKSLPKSSNIESLSSLELPPASSNLVEAENKEKSQDKKYQSVSVILTDIAEEFAKLDTKNGLSFETDEPISSTNKANFNCFTNNSEDNAMVKKCISSEIKGEALPGCLQNTSNSSSSSVSSEKEEELPAVSNNKNEDQIISTKVHHIKDNGNIKIQRGKGVKKANFDKEKRPLKSHNSIASKRVHFYYDEMSIENVESEPAPSKNRVRKCVAKCKAGKNLSTLQKNNSKNAALTSSFILPDDVSKLGKNSFLVTAEVHPPPNSIDVLKKKNQCPEKLQPCVVLTDIFKSNQGLLSEMIGSIESGGLQKTVSDSAAASLATLTVNDVKTSCMDFENSVYDQLLEKRSIAKKVFCQERSNESQNACKNPFTVLRDIINSGKALTKCSKVHSNEENGINSAPCLFYEQENRVLPVERKVIAAKGKRRQAKIVSYKEPSLNVKMRRLL